MSEKMVIIMDPVSREKRTIPAIELGPGMAQVQDGAGGDLVWVPMDQLKWMPFNRQNDGKHWTEEFQKRVRVLRDTLLEVFPETMTEWEQGFRQDTNPDIELLRWEALAAAYRDHCDVSRPRRKEVYSILIHASFANREHAFKVIPQTSLPKKKIRAVLESYFDHLEDLAP